MDRISALAPVLSLVLLGCSTSQPVDPAGPRHATVITPALETLPARSASTAQTPGVRQFRGPVLPLESGAPELLDEFKGRVCQLGTSCMALDSRPFEMCLVGTGKRCGDKIRKPLLVEKPGSGSR